MDTDNQNPSLNLILQKEIAKCEKIPHEDRSSMFQAESRKQFTLRKKEREIVTAMNKLYVDMVIQLQYFKQDKYDFEDLQDGKANEIKALTRSVKKEVIDIADQVDTMANQMNEQNFTISNMQYTLNKQDQKMENIFNMLNKLMVQNNRNAFQDQIIHQEALEVDHLNQPAGLLESSRDMNDARRQSSVADSSPYK